MSEAKEIRENVLDAEEIRKKMRVIYEKNKNRYRIDWSEKHKEVVKGLRYIRKHIDKNLAGKDFFDAMNRIIDKRKPFSYEEIKPIEEVVESSIGWYKTLIPHNEECREYYTEVIAELNRYLKRFNLEIRRQEIGY